MKGVASIVPIEHLSLLEHDEYHMALVHMCGDPTYYQFYKDQVKAGKYVILDNSTVELGEPMDPDVYLVDAMRMGASEVLYPDWLYEADHSIEAGKDFIKRAKKWGYKGKFMGAPQGKTEDEWLECAIRMLEWPETTCLGVSRRYEKFWSQGRLAAVQGLYQVMESMKRENDVTVHLLGCWEMPEWDVFPSMRLPYVRGVDSGLPSHFSANGIVMTEGARRQEGKIDFHHQYREALIRENLYRWRMLCRKGTLHHE